MSKGRENLRPEGSPSGLDLTSMWDVAMIKEHKPALKVIETEPGIGPEIVPFARAIGASLPGVGSE